MTPAVSLFLGVPHESEPHVFIIDLVYVANSDTFEFQIVVKR
ncbi:hypothetical protein LCGC14_1320270 [marine sediment metagenome]|uniref:Uncharacterized protein n=1 Tax=marine sediment metagenome TaxID=412755 RepID=A0A0F9L512_9ZZZZ